MEGIYGDFSASSLHSFLALPNPGSQWPEARAFARMANVHAAARLVQVLCGLQGFVLYGGDAADAAGAMDLSMLTEEQRGQAARDIAGIIKILVESCPSVLTGAPSNEEDLSLGPYVADERMPAIVERAFVWGGILRDEPSLAEKELGQT